MSGLKRGLTGLLGALIIIGWVTYPGLIYRWYFNWPEQYAFPASTTKPHDPPWGFWFW